MSNCIIRAAQGAALVLAMQAPAAAQTLFYNGQWNLVDGQTSATNTGNPNQVIFENFVVGGSGWNVTGVFGEFLVRGAGWMDRCGKQVVRSVGRADRPAVQPVRRAGQAVRRRGEAN